MSAVIFAVPRTTYGSYRDLYRLIELAEYPTVYIDEIDPASDNTYIMTISNGENQNGFENPKARIILWDFEHRIESYPRIPGCAEYWHMDAAQARQHGVRYVPVGGDARLRLTTPVTSDVKYDVAYMAYFTNRRDHIRAQIAERGLRFASNSWGEERHERLTNSMAYLHVHQLEKAPAVPALRMVVAAAYKLPVITERFAEPGIFEGMCLEADYDDLALYAASVIKSHAYVLPEFGQALYELLCQQFTFRGGVEAHV